MATEWIDNPYDDDGGLLGGGPFVGRTMVLGETRYQAMGRMQDGRRLTVWARSEDAARKAWAAEAPRMNSDTDRLMERWSGVLSALAKGPDDA